MFVIFIVYYCEVLALFVQHTVLQYDNVWDGGLQLLLMENLEKLKRYLEEILNQVTHACTKIGQYPRKSQDVQPPPRNNNKQAASYCQGPLTKLIKLNGSRMTQIAKPQI